MNADAALPRQADRQAGNFIDRILNVLFGLTPTAARVRGGIVWGLLAVIWIFLAWNIDPEGWQLVLSNFSTAVMSGDAINLPLTFQALLGFAFSRIFAGQVLIHILTLVGPFLIAWQLAAIYLQDIFELEHASTARRFIMQAALASRYNRIRIREGSVAAGDSDSPIILIGGPGRVVVELDSVAIFEGIDGTPRVIGPTYGLPYNAAILNGFERLREVIDLRDLTTDPITNKSRSRDGIPVEARDVRLRYSIQRSNEPSTHERPYPFLEDAARSLVYQQVSLVTPGQPGIGTRGERWNQGYRRWSGSIPGLITGALSDFTGERNLSAFLANTSEAELQALFRLAEQVRQASHQMAPEENEHGPAGPDAEPPEFTSRPTFTGLFYDFASGFPQRAGGRGGQVEWIGVGTWSTPAAAQLINESHLEAWRISRENYMRGHEATLRGIRGTARLQELQNILQELPLAAYRQARQEGLAPRNLVNRLLLAYKEQMVAVLDLYHRDQQLNPDAPPPPDRIVQAVRILNALLAHRF
jgi:hypothetical protein